MYSYRDPKVPSALTIFEPLQVGSVIEVQGHVLPGRERDFAVELLSGPTIVLHVNFRFIVEQSVVMNSSFDGNWGSEIKHKNPLITTDNFDLKIKILHDHFHITCNGGHIAIYPHRCPFQSVQVVGLKGNIHVDKVNFEGFPFKKTWGGEHDFGHNGYNMYGTEVYVPPIFNGQAEPFNNKGSRD